MRLQLDVFYPWGKPTDVFNKIRARQKIHHIVIDGDHQVGDSIEFAHTNDEGEKPFYFEYPDREIFDTWSAKKTDQGGEIYFPVCVAIEPIHMRFERIKDGDKRKVEGVVNQLDIMINIGDFYMNDVNLVELIASNEGFNNYVELFDYFVWDAGEDFTVVEKYGKIIHWTDQIYNCSVAETLAMKKISDSLKKGDHC